MNILSVMMFILTDSFQTQFERTYIQRESKLIFYVFLPLKQGAR